MIPGLSELMVYSQPEQKQVKHVGQLRVEQGRREWHLLSGRALIHWLGIQLVTWGLKLQASELTPAGSIVGGRPSSFELCSDGCC